MLKHRSIRPLVEQLENYLRTQHIRAYHCTREPLPGFFRTQGLQLTDVNRHQNEFLKKFSAKFTANELVEMKAAWESHFVLGGQTKHRNGLLWFCLSRTLALSPGTEAFFRYFGGEAIFMPLKRHSTIAAKLGAIGEPVIVEVSLPGAAVRAHQAMSTMLLSAYHRFKRNDSFLHAAETSVKCPFDASHILAVTPLADFRI